MTVPPSLRGTPAALLSVLLLAAAWSPFFLRCYNADFSAYWSAASVVRQGGDPYVDSPRSPDGGLFPHNPFLYAPQSLPLLLPLSAASYESAKGAWLVVEIASLVLVGWLAGLSARQALWTAAGLLALMPLATFPLWAHLERGQMDLVVLLTIAMAWRAWESGHGIAAGLALAVAGALKLPALLLFVAPALERDRKVLAGGVLGSALLVAASLAWAGPEIQRRYWLELLPRLTQDTHAPARSERRWPMPGPRTAWEGSTYAGRVPIVTPNGSVARSLNRLRPRLGTATAALAVLTSVAVMLYAGRATRERRGLRRWRWATAMVTALVWHPMTWVMAYVWLLLPAILLRPPGGWRQYFAPRLEELRRRQWGRLVRSRVTLALVLVGNPCTPSVALGGALLWLELLAQGLRHREPIAAPGAPAAEPAAVITA